MTHVNNSFPRSLIVSTTAMLFVLLLWFLPYSHQLCEQIDQYSFLYLNKTLLWSTYWQQICGWLNHPNETWLNLIVMIGLNFTAVLFIKKEQRKQALFFIVYCWFLFQFGILFSHIIFKDLLNIERASPSLLLTPIVKLSEVVTHKVKYYSENSLPAGHTFVLIYWAGFTAKYATKKFMFLTYLVALILILPRLISGAHWLSDIIFTMIISYLWLAIATDTPLYYYCVNFIKKLSFSENIKSRRINDEFRKIFNR